VSYLIDTNIISELRRKEANPGVVDWFAVRPANTLYLSVLSLGEIRKGIEALPNSMKRWLIDGDGCWRESSAPRRPSTA
jgi:predicted nucleic acid-binding protein